MAKQKTRRVFFALWPDETVRQQIMTVFQQSPQAQLPERFMRPENLHLTLHFMGNVPEQKLDCYDHAAQQVHVPPFKINLDQYSYFSQAKVFTMSCSTIPDALLKLYTSLAEGLTCCGYQQETRLYMPHVSLMRKLSEPGVINFFEHINWSVNNFVLVESVSVNGGVLYQVIRRYQLKII
ncbi:MAG: RNA 2',3'-cyclic phosphodiesterase [Gammaproteobacteria bacterium]|nr:RNA 2',3'-cyclic phosphodiesterase [Gammaproteobacteria bacterium]